MSPVTQCILIFDDECSSCSVIAQLIRAKMPDVTLLSIYSARARLLLRQHYPAGWAFRPYLVRGSADGIRVVSGARLWLTVAALLGPAGMMAAGRAWLSRRRRQRGQRAWMVTPELKLRAQQVPTVAAGETLAEERLVLPDTGSAALSLLRIIHFHNARGPVQTVSYWHAADGVTLTIEQMHRPLSRPVASGGQQAETMTLASGRVADYYELPAAAQPNRVLIMARPDGRFISLRGNGMEKQAFMALAATLDPGGDD